MQDLRKSILRAWVCLAFLPIQLYAQGNENSWEKFVATYCEGYQALELPPLRIAYVDNLNGIKDEQELLEQQSFFDTSQKNLGAFSIHTLAPKQQLEYELMHYQVKLNKARIAVEQKWLERGSKSFSREGLSQLDMGKELYRYYLKRWIDLSVEPDSMFEFGLKEIHRVKGKMKLLQQKSGMDSVAFGEYVGTKAFFWENPDDVQAAFEAYDQQLRESLGKYFPELDRIPPHLIQRGTDKRLAQVPGFYRNNTFFYNIFDAPFNKRQIAWLYLHEAVPGHHYQRSYNALLQLSPLQPLINLLGFSEGWAAYIEDVGLEIGLYPNESDELGKWEWDIIRSVRVSLDVALNYYNWTDERALEFWKKHISNLDNIGLREIARMKRWPAQVITYKYGANKILHWKHMLEREEGFDLKVFHEEVLRRGPLPYSILEKYILNQSQN